MILLKYLHLLLQYLLMILIYICLHPILELCKEKLKMNFKILTTRLVQTIFLFNYKKHLHYIKQTQT